MKKFIEEQVGITWLMFLIVSGIYGWIKLSIGWQGLLAFPIYIIWGSISAILVNWVKPAVIMTNGGFMSLLWAKIFWNFGAHIGVMIVSLIFISNLIKDISERPSFEKLKQNVDVSCNTEQIKKTGTKSCKGAKKEFSMFINKELSEIRKEYNIAKMQKII